MSLTALYERFIASPNPLSLAENASLHYITTLTSHSQPGSIIRHLESQNKHVVTVKRAKTISAVEGQNALAIEIDTTIEFISGGGAYLPGLENFVVDKMATLPITHVVLFDSEKKISQIRISWDQGSLLQQTDIIGSRGKNWPVVDGKDQIRLIASSESAAPVPTSTSAASPRGRGTSDNGPAARNASPNKKHIKDPYASLDLFGPQRTDENQSTYEATHAIAPRASAKPPPREMNELFAAGHEDFEDRPGSPKKSYAEPTVAPKGAGSRNYGAIRVFDQEQEESVNEPHIYKTNPARYNHFDLGDNDANDPMQFRAEAKGKPMSNVPMRARTDKHGSQWNFSDFDTPAKVPMKLRAQDKVNINWDEEEKNQTPPGKGGAAQKSRRDAEAHFEFKDDGTPVDRHAIPKPRRDAETHFAFQDQPTPAPKRIIGRTEAAKGLYRDVLHDEDEKAPLASISSNARKNTFGSQWDTPDETPANRKAGEKETAKRPTSKGQPRAMETHWSRGNEEEQAKKTTAAGAAGGKQGFWDF